MLKKIWIIVLVAGAFGCSDRLADMQQACEGTWQLESRTMADGSVMRAPQVQGTIHWEPIDSRKAHVAVTIVQNEEGKHVLDHSLSTYEISTSAITRKRHALIQRGYRDREGAPLSHYVRAKTEKGKASVEGAEVTYFHAAKGETGVEKSGDEGFKQVYAGDVMTSTYTDAFTDKWRRVQ
jgi:hypothetical protein